MAPYEEFTKWIFEKVRSPDHVVVIEALRAINTLYYYRSDGLLLPHLTDPTFLKALAANCEIRQDLISETRIGAIKITTDSGSDLRWYSIGILNNLLVSKDIPMNQAQTELFLGPISRLLKDQEKNRLAAFRILNRILKNEENKRIVTENFKELWGLVVECFNDFDNARVKSHIEEGGIKWKCLKKLINMIAWVQHTLQSDDQKFDLSDAA